MNQSFSFDVNASLSSREAERLSLTHTIFSSRLNGDIHLEYCPVEKYFR